MCGRILMGEVPGVNGTLGKTNSLFEPTQTGSGTAPPIEAAVGWSRAPRLANSLAVSFSGRNVCPGTRCSLIVEERKNSACQICQKV